MDTNKDAEWIKANCERLSRLLEKHPMRISPCGDEDQFAVAVQADAGVMSFRNARGGALNYFCPITQHWCIARLAVHLIEVVTKVVPGIEVLRQAQAWVVEETPVARCPVSCRHEVTGHELINCLLTIWELHNRPTGKAWLKARFPNGHGVFVFIDKDGHKDVRDVHPDGTWTELFLKKISDDTCTVLWSMTDEQAAQLKTQHV